MATEHPSYVTLTNQNFHEEVIQNPNPVLVDFWAPWCGPCQTMNPVIGELAKEYEGQALVGKVNVDEQPLEASQYGIQSIPTFLIFRGGKVVDHVIGAVPKHVLIDKLNAAVTGA